MAADAVGWIIALVVGAALGAAPRLVRSLRGRPVAPGPAPRPNAWPLVAVTAAVTLLVAGAAGYFALRLLLRPEPARPASVAGAVEAFRGTGCPADAGAAGSNPGGGFATPEPGVYIYRASGHFELRAPLFGTEERDLGPTVPATVLVDGDRWTWAARFFERRLETREFVAGPGRRLEVTRLTTDDVHFRIAVRSVMTCTPGVVVPADAAIGAAWDRTCDSATDFGTGTRHAMPTRATLVGLELVAVGDERIPAYRVRQETTVGGDQTGDITAETWFATSNGLPLRTTVSSRTVGMARNVEEYTLDLTSMVPQR